MQCREEEGQQAIADLMHNNEELPKDVVNNVLSPIPSSLIRGSDVWDRRNISVITETATIVLKPIKNRIASVIEQLGYRHNEFRAGRGIKNAIMLVAKNDVIECKYCLQYLSLIKIKFLSEVNIT